MALGLFRCMAEHSSVAAALAHAGTVNRGRVGCLTDFLIAPDSSELIVLHGLNEKNCELTCSSLSWKQSWRVSCDTLPLSQRCQESIRTIWFQFCTCIHKSKPHPEFSKLNTHVFLNGAMLRLSKPPVFMGIHLPGKVLPWGGCT